MFLQDFKHIVITKHKKNDIFKYEIKNDIYIYIKEK